ncbi:MAG: hypothetical protein IJ629_01290 [Clostridia bacterium]|nr:hypothetical protein [Clostridia bacterium]
MKCYKCGKEAPLKSGLCNDCYQEVLQNKYRKRKKRLKDNFVLNNIDHTEKILNKVKPSKLSYFLIFSVFAISMILFPKTIIEFFIRSQSSYFLVLIFNILFFFVGVYLVVYLMSRDIYLTNKRIIGKWGLFKIKKINIPLSSVQFIDIYSLGGLEIDTAKKNYFFDFVGNGRKFKFSTIEQIKILIDSADSEKTLLKFSHSLQQKLEEYQLEESNPNMICCSCCKELISRDSIYCVHCGKPVPENERTIDMFLGILCFLIPPVGLILFLLNIGPYPKFAKQCLLSSVFSMFLILIGILSLISLL